MAIIASSKSGKQFEKPETGMYHGLLADVVDLGNVTTQYKGEVKVQHMIRLVWVLNTLGKDKEKYPDTFGKPLTVAQRFNLSLNEKSNLYETVKQILNAPPPVSDAQPEYDVEQLLGVVRKIFILREVSEKGQDYPNIKGISAADAGVTVSLPVGFVRASAKPPKSQAVGHQAYQQPAAPQGADVSF